MSKHHGIPVGAYRRLLARYLRTQWPTFALLALLLGASIAMQIGMPQILRSFLDALQSPAPGQAPLLAAALFVGVALLRQVLSTFAIYLGEGVGWNATNALRFDLLEHCLRLDQSFHKAHTPGELIERIDGDTTVLSNFFYMFVIYVVGNAVLLGGILVALTIEDWRMGLVFSVYSVSALFLLTAMRNVSVPLWLKLREHVASFYGFLGEWLAGTEDIRANGAEGYVMRRFGRLKHEWLGAQLKAATGGSILWAVTSVVFAVQTAAAYLFGAALYRRGLISIGTVYMIVSYAALIQSPIIQIRFQIDYLQRAQASMNRIDDLRKTRSRLAEGARLPLPEGALSLSMRGVSFGYDAGEPVLHELSFSLKPGRVLGLLGRTGSGKTTVARLLLRLYDPTEGRVEVGGVALSDASLAQVRRRVGMVSQEVQLFQASLRDNLTFFDSEVPDGRIVEVLESLQLLPWYSSLPAGLDTELEAGGGGLSAGEAQLLAFARVFLADPGLVILDEASSRLDPFTERLIQSAVDRLLRGRTGVVIAHHLATLNRADDVLILDGGRVSEHGRRDELMLDPGSRFSALLAASAEGVIV